MRIKTNFPASLLFDGQSKLGINIMNVQQEVNLEKFSAPTQLLYLYMIVESTPDYWWSSGEE